MSASVITELIVGYMLPGRPVAMMMFKVRTELIIRTIGEPMSSLLSPLDLGLHHDVTRCATCEWGRKQWLTVCRAILHGGHEAQSLHEDCECYW